MPTVSKQSPKEKPPAKGGIFDRIVDVADSVKDEGIKMAIFGRSGSGKTTLLSTFPKPMLIVVCSNSAAGETRSIANVPGIKTFTIEDEAELPLLVKDQRENDRYQTFALDHVSAFSDLIMSKILKEKGRESPVTADWQDLNMTLKQRLADMLKLRSRVVINSQEREFNTEGSDNPNEMLMPNVSFALSPGVAGWLGPAVDYMVYTFKRMGTRTTGRKVKVGDKEIDGTEEAVEYCLRVGPHPVYNTKFRVPRGTVLPDVISDPTYDKIMKLINGK